MTTEAPITGIVLGFLLIIDPDNEKGKYERLEFLDATAMDARMQQITQEDKELYRTDPTLSYVPTEQEPYTIYLRDDNSELDADEGFDPSGKVKVGDAGYRVTCADCSFGTWFPGPAKERFYRCSDCREQDLSAFEEELGM